MKGSLQHSESVGCAAEPGRLRRIAREELGELNIRWRMVRLLASLIPSGTGLRLRSRLYRLAGIRVGAGSVISGNFHITGDHPSRRLQIGANCYLNERISFNLGGDVVIEAGVSVGMECLFLTVTHELGGPEGRGARTRTAPVRVGRGAWLGARVIVLPGVTIGSGAVIGAGAVVSKDIPPNTLAVGIPARVLKTLETT